MLILLTKYLSNYFIILNGEIMLLSEIGKNIKKRRKLLHINQLEMCNIAEISQHTLSAVENGKGNPSIETLLKILDILGMEIDMRIRKI